MSLNQRQWFQLWTSQLQNNSYERSLLNEEGVVPYVLEGAIL